MLHVVLLTFLISILFIAVIAIQHIIIRKYRKEIFYIRVSRQKSGKEVMILYYENKTLKERLEEQTKLISVLYDENQELKAGSILNLPLIYLAAMSINGWVEPPCYKSCKYRGKRSCCRYNINLANTGWIQPCKKRIYNERRLNRYNKDKTKKRLR